MELRETALRAHMPRLGGAMIPTRRLDRVTQHALALEIALADGEGRFRIARRGRRSEQREGAFRRGLGETLAREPCARFGEQRREAIERFGE